MPILTAPTRTLVSEDERALLSYLGALRRACAGHTLRDDAAEFLRLTAHLPDEVAVLAMPEGLFLACDEDGRPLAWYPSSRSSAA